MKLTQLKYIVEVAETGTISKAAENLYLSQPSLTAAIKELESEFDITIFSRTNKGVVLTKEGEEFRIRQTDDRPDRADGGKV